MALPEHIKNYITKYKEDLENNNFDNLFGAAFYNIHDDRMRQKIINIFIKDANINFFEYLNYLDEYAFAELRLPKTLTVPKVKEIKPYSLRHTNVENLYAPNCNLIDYSGLASCEALKHVNLKNVSHVDDYGFSECSSLREVELPNLSSIGESIGEHAFLKCTSLKSLYIPTFKLGELGAYTAEQYILYLFNNNPAQKDVHALEKLYIDGSNLRTKYINKKKLAEHQEFIKQRFPKLQVIDNNTGDIIRDYR